MVSTARPDLGELCVVLAEHIVDGRLANIVQEVEAGRRQPGDILDTHQILRLIGADHIIIDIYPHPVVCRRVVGKVLALARDLGDPPEPNRPTRTWNPSTLDQAIESTADLEDTRSPTRVIIRGELLLLEVSSKDYVLLEFGLSTEYLGLDHHLPGLRALR